MKEPKTVEEYLSTMPDDKREELEKLRTVVKKNLPKGVEEGICYGIIGYFVPHSIYPDGYHCDPEMPLPYGGIAMRKNFLTLYLNTLYYRDSDREWFEKEYAKTGKKLDMGKSCIRFKKADDIPLELIGKAIARVPVKDFIKWYESSTPVQKHKAKKKGIAASD
ncbi:MAG: DUF1801 domain-containing protein [Fimbriimonadales bacterium]